jgi:hypothetical protein
MGFSNGTDTSGTSLTLTSHAVHHHHVFFTGQSTTFSRTLTGQSSGKRENDETFEVQDCVLFA